MCIDPICLVPNRLADFEPLLQFLRVEPYHSEPLVFHRVIEQPFLSHLHSGYVPVVSSLALLCFALTLAHVWGLLCNDSLEHLERLLGRILMRHTHQDSTVLLSPIEFGIKHIDLYTHETLYYSRWLNRIRTSDDPSVLPRGNLSMYVHAWLARASLASLGLGLIQ